MAVEKKYDSEGKIVEEAKKPCMQRISTAASETWKSKPPSEWGTFHVRGTQAPQRTFCSDGAGSAERTRRRPPRRCREKPVAVGKAARRIAACCACGVPGSGVVQGGGGGGGGRARRRSTRATGTVPDCEADPASRRAPRSFAADTIPRASPPAHPPARATATATATATPRSPSLQSATLFWCAAVRPGGPSPLALALRSRCPVLGLRALVHRCPTSPWCLYCSALPLSSFSPPLPPAPCTHTHTHTHTPAHDERRPSPVRAQRNWFPASSSSTCS